MNRLSLFLVIGMLVLSGCTTPTGESGNPAPVVTFPPTATPAPAGSIAPAGTPAIPSLTVPSTSEPVTAVVTQSPTPLQKTLALLADSALNTRVQDAKNKLDQLKNSDKADTLLIPAGQGNCEVKKSRELGYLIDAGSGEMVFVKGDYGKIALDLFRKSMVPGHTYVILHTHAKDWVICPDVEAVSFDTFSLGDLATASTLNEQGYHVQKVIAVSDKMYEIYPKIPDGWKTPDDIYRAVNGIEQRRETRFHTDYFDPYLNTTSTFYDVDNLMPLLSKELNYTYVADTVVLA